MTTTAEVKIRAGVAGVESIRGLGRELGGLRGQLHGLGIGFSYFRTALSVAGVVAWTKSIINSADQAGKLAQRVGSTAEAVSALQYAFQLGDAEDFEGTMDRLNRTMGAAAEGSKKQVAALKAVGVTQAEIKAGSVDTAEALLRTAEAFEKMPDGVAKATLAQTLFGKSGAQLIPFLNQGRDGIAELTAEAERLGIVISSDTAAAADEFNDNLTRLHAQARGFTLTAANALLPTLTDITSEFGDLFAQKTEGIDFFTGLAEASRVLAMGLVTVYSALRGVMQGITAGWRIANAFATGGIDAAADEARRQQEAFVDITMDWARSIEDLKKHSTIFGDGGAGRPKPKAGGSGGRTGGYDLDLGTDEAERERERMLKKSNDAMADYFAFAYNFRQSLEDETKALTMSSDEIELNAALREIDAEATKKMAGVSVEAQDAIQGEAEALKEETRALMANKQAREKMASTGFVQFMHEMREIALDDAALIKDALTGAFDSAGDALAEFVTTGKLNFQDFVRSVLADFAKLMVQKALAQMVVSVFGGSTTGATVAHTGGIIGSTALPGRAVPLSVFAGAPRYHGGGVIGAGEVPAILKKGEGVFTPEQMRAMGGNTVSVTVNTGTGQTKVDSANGQDAARLGRLIGNVVIEKLLEQQRPGGLLAPA